MSDSIGIGNCPVIDDSTDLAHPDLNAGLKGMLVRDFSKHPYCAVAGTAPFPSELIIPQSEWADRIKRQEAEQSSLVHLADAMGVPVKNQASTNFCWFNAPTHCVELLRAKQGQQYVELSPASGACLITGFHNVGGYGPDAVAEIAEKGIVPASLWPCNAIDKKYNTAAADAERPKYQIDGWWDLDPNNLDAEINSCLLRNIPVASGIPAWGHEIAFVRLVVVNGQFARVFDNSWGTSWGDKGRGVMVMGGKMRPNDGIAPRFVTAN